MERNSILLEFPKQCGRRLNQRSIEFGQRDVRREVVELMLIDLGVCFEQLAQLRLLFPLESYQGSVGEELIQTISDLSIG